MEYTPAQRAAQTYQILNRLSPANISFLTRTDSFQLLISVIMSAQTTDRQVNEVASVLFERYPTPQDLAQADIESVKTIIRSTGFYNTKAKNIIGTAKDLVERFNATVPLEMKDLITLPGVGRKTANVIIGQIAQKPAIIVDTHFARVVQRVGLTTSKDPEGIEKEVAKLLPPQQHYRYSMTVNLHGRQICHARKPLCFICPIAQWCASFPIQ